MHILVFLQHYHTPDCPTAARPYALVEQLSHNHEVTVITTRAWEEKRVAHRFSWIPSGVRLIRLDIPYDNSMSILERLRAFLQYASRAVVQGVRLSSPDLIIGSSTPLTAAAAAATVARIRDVPWIFEVRDLWPEFPIQMGAIPNCGFQQLLYALESVLYRSAAQVVTLSPDMKAHVRTVSPSSSVTTVEYGSDLRLINGISRETTAALRSRFDLNRRFFVLYGGTFGRANAIPSLIDAAKQLSNRTDLLFGFAGRGYHESIVQRAARRYDHIRLVEPLPYPEALALFSIADLSIVSFIDRPVLSANSPGKFYDSLATGTPVVVTNRGWTKRFVERHDCGWYVPPESPGCLAKRIRSVIEKPDSLARTAKNAQEVAHRRFDRSERLNEYTALIEHTANSRG